jgi:hypothetical protein
MLLPHLAERGEREAQVVGEGDAEEAEREDGDERPEGGGVEVFEVERYEAWVC